MSKKKVVKNNYKILSLFLIVVSLIAVLLFINKEQFLNADASDKSTRCFRIYNKKACESFFGNHRDLCSWVNNKCVPALLPTAKPVPVCDPSLVCSVGRPVVGGKACLSKNRDGVPVNPAWCCPKGQKLEDGKNCK